MTEHRFTDAATVSGARRTSDGFLVADAFVARTGIQVYSGSEVGLVDLPVVRVWRPEAEVKDVASVRTYSHAPVTMGHPSEMVDAGNWATLAKGEVSTEAEWVDGKLKLPLIIKDAETIAAIESGTRQLSAGYTSEIEFTDGVTPEGEPYDAIQRNIRINHVAVVPRGRAGEEFRIGDGAEKWGASPFTDAEKKESSMTLRKIMVDGFEVETTDAGATALEKLQKTIETKDAELATKDADHAKEIAAKDAAIAKAEAERDAEKAKVISDADLDKKVQARADLVSKAKAIVSDVKTEGLSDADIRKAVVKAKLGDEAVEGKSEAYLDARFDILAEGIETKDAAAEHLKEGQKVVTDMNAVHTKFAQGLSDAWKNPTGTKED